jgi:hypothetical protein
MAVTINIPSQVKTYANLAAFPASGSLKTIYIAEDTNKTYRWDGSTYVEISASAAMTWGQIGGTLSNQTDLQNALDAKVPTARTLTINGTTQDLSANRTFTIPTDLTVGTTPISSGTIGRVLFQGTGNVLQQSSSLFWDNTNEQLQIVTSNTSSAFRGLSVSQFGNFIGGAPIRFDKARGTSATPTDVSSLDIVGAFSFNPRVGGAYTQDRALFGANMASSTGVGVFIIGGTANNTYTPGVYVHPSNNVTIGSSQSIITGITDAGFRLDVNGTARVTSLTTMDLVSTSPNQIIFIKNSSGTTAGRIFPDGSILRLSSSNSLLALSVFANANIGIGQATDAGFRLDVNGTARVATSILVGSSSTQGTIQTGVFRGTFFNDYANNFTIFQVQTSGNVSFYNSVAIGTTSAPSASKLRVVGLPTSSAGLSAGDIWNDGGTLKIV